MCGASGIKEYDRRTPELSHAPPHMTIFDVNSIE